MSLCNMCSKYSMLSIGIIPCRHAICIECLRELEKSIPEFSECPKCGHALQDVLKITAEDGLIEKMRDREAGIKTVHIGDIGKSDVKDYIQKLTVLHYLEQLSPKELGEYISMLEHLITAFNWLSTHRRPIICFLTIVVILFQTAVIVLYEIILDD